MSLLMAWNAAIPTNFAYAFEQRSSRGALVASAVTGLPLVEPSAFDGVDTQDASTLYSVEGGVAFGAPADVVDVGAQTGGVWDGSRIHIANFTQLWLIGSNAQATSADFDVNTVGVGEPLVREDGTSVAYTLDADYYLDCDIELPADWVWQLPEGFSGTFSGPADADRARVYDPSTDTVFIQNLYQLSALVSEGREEMPVVMGDAEPSTFGMGELLLEGLEGDTVLTYSARHRYVLSAAFTAEVAVPQFMSLMAAPMLLGAGEGAEATATAAHADGRDFFGQVVVNIGGTNYILIGDRQQLDAINNSTSTHRPNVCGAVYKVVQTRASLVRSWDDPSNITSETAELVYPGDADLISDVPLPDGTTSDFTAKKLWAEADVGHLIPGHTYDYHDLGEDGALTYTRTVWCAVDPATGAYDLSKHSNNDNQVSGLTYTKSGNYIVFRDIDMLTQLWGTWKPLMFQGTMLGAKAAATDEVSTLWDAGKTQLNMDVANKPTIHDFAVVPKTLTQLGTVRLDLSEQTGVGFFGTITGNYNESSVIDSPALVQNIRLLNGTVDNPTVKADIDQSVVNLLVTAVATVLGVLLDPILRVLIGKDIGLRALLTGLLDARAKDPTSLATGAFAGRVIAKASVIDCEVENVAVSTVATTYEGDGKIVGKGGFVGHVEGETKYDGLSNALGSVTGALSLILNLIPGLGLGDLVTVLLVNALPLQNLIPTGYTIPVVSGCTVTNGSLSTEDGKIGVGGFAGSASGAQFVDCAVRESTMEVHADHFAGGFIGLERDAMIKGTLSDLGVDIGSLHPQSELIRCSIEDSDIEVTGGSYLGGFAGAMANSYGINDTVSGGSILVDGTGDYVGGFTGYAHLGTLFGFGEYLIDDVSLLSTLKGLVTALLGEGKDQSLLDVGGVAPSAIVGFVSNTELTVASEGGFVGGIVGRGNGTYIGASSEAMLRELGKYDTMRDGAYTTPLPIDSALEGRGTYVSNLVSVSAGETIDSGYNGKSFAGGIAGYLTSANIGGLLGATVGVGQYLGFTVDNVIIEGAEGGYTVSALHDYGAGGIGWAVGGDVQDAYLYELASVSAGNHAAGFVGATGPGDLVSGEGLDLTLLGITLLSIDNLLSLVSGVRTTYLRANVYGVDAGYTVAETGVREGGSQEVFAAGGWAGEANSVRVVDCHAERLASVTANDADGVAGGFVALSAAGGLAGIAEGKTSLSVAQLGQLIDAVPYLVPSYDGCSVAYVDGGYVQAHTAGGFSGDFQSGTINANTAAQLNPIDNSAYEYTNGTPVEPWSVYNIDHVRGGAYGGGWGGKVHSGALVSAGGGLSVLSGLTNLDINASQILGLAEAYVPTIAYAGVYSADPGFTVFAALEDTPGAPASDGYAGGFIGYGSGVQVSYSDVYRLRHGAITEPDPLEGVDGSAYMVFDPSPAAIPYAVAGGRYAGGYIGHMDVGSAASVGGGLQLLGRTLTLTNVLDVLGAVVSTVEHSNVYGSPGGFNVLASSHVNLGDGAYDSPGVGYAGGFAGRVSGGHIQDSNVELFAYIVGEVAAGGYAGELEPGDVAHVLDSGSISLLGQLNDVASLVQDFVPTVRNSQTTCIPCGGAVRAQSFSDGTDNQGSVVRGMAGGYVGHAAGAQIWGNSDDRWKDEATYTGTQRECAAIRIRSVYGAEYAGGYCGFMECASTAQTGGLNLLGGLLNVSSLLGALDTVYPTFRHCAVYGPLALLDEATFYAWQQYVGSYGAFASELANASYEDLDRFVYGYHAVAGRSSYDPWATTALSGCAGGFVGSMHGGVIHDSHAEDAKLVRAMRAAGGFAGEMQTRGLNEFGSVGLIGGALNLNLGNMVSILNVFVPEISSSGTNGYDYGLDVHATGYAGEDDTGLQAGVGNAGGYLGAGYGAQLGLRDSAATPGVWVHGLREVAGVNDIGGFVGHLSAASVLSLDTESASDSFLQRVLDRLISTPTQLLDVMNATVATIKYADVTAADPNWGFVVNGIYNDGGSTRYAVHAGGFAGSLEASVLGQRNNADDTLEVHGLRSVAGGHHAGGFFGIAQVGSVAQVGGDSGSGAQTSILDLIELGNVSLLDAFRSYIYHASVEGVADGITVYAYEDSYTGVMGGFSMTGAAGGFGGGLYNGTVENSSVTNLNYAVAPRYAAGFIGYAGKDGGVSVDGARITGNTPIGRILEALGLNLATDLKLLDIAGATITNCSVEGFGEGFIAEATTPMEPISGIVDWANLTGSCAAGFVGLADTTQIEDCHVSAFKKAVSPQVAGGFVGRTAFSYLVDLDVSSGLTSVLFQIVNLLVRILYLPELERIALINADGGVLGLKLLADGDLLYVNLLGLRIAVSLVKNDPEYEGSDAVVVTLGSSTIKLPVDENGIKGEEPDLSITLIEGNRTAIRRTSVTGIDEGYDVFGGGASDNADGAGELAYAGGYVGRNDGGFISHANMYLCDVVRASDGRVGPFAGHTEPYSRNIDYLEGSDNHFSVYRSDASAYDRAQLASGVVSPAQQIQVGDTLYNQYEFDHISEVPNHVALMGAVQAGSGGSVDLGAWASAAKAVLMDDTPLADNDPGNTPKPSDKKDPCDEEFDLTVSKRWDDLLNLAGKRPQSITVMVNQVDVGTAPPDELVAAGTPSAGDQRTKSYTLELDGTMTLFPFSLAWTETLEDLPVAYWATVEGEPGEGETEEIHYYKYYVSEISVDGYRTSYRVDGDSAHVVITNVYTDSLLPELGGAGTYLFALIGIVLIALAARRLRRAGDLEGGDAPAT